MNAREAKKSKTKAGRWLLEVPLDASSIEGRDAQKVKVVAQTRDGSLVSQTVEVKAGSQSAAHLDLPASPGPLRLYIGPGDAADDDLPGLQTLTLEVPERHWSRPRLELPPTVIGSYHWYWWLRWCRTFVVRGRVVCPDGSPVPAATVCAYDIDAFWWWSSKQLVGCAVTDINGTFELKFRWCCGWWPWWWWRQRIWQVDPDLAERVRSVLDQRPDLRLARAGHQPTTDVFREIVSNDVLDTAGLLEPARVHELEGLRDRLLRRLPASWDFEQRRIWPWAPWNPWWDCTPDLVFKVTQDCETPGTVLLDEGFLQTRWNIPNPLDVTLTVGSEACCLPICQDPPCDEGECLTITSVCGVPIHNIGGNPSAPTAPVGYAKPGAVTPGTAQHNGDRPFASTVRLVKNAGDMTGVDYYEIEMDDGSGWAPLPPGTALAFYRTWLLWNGSTWSHGSAHFPFTMISGHEVVESREHFEDHGPFSDWWPSGGSRIWTANKYLVAPLDSSKLGDQTYRFRVVGWRRNPAGNLVDRRVLPSCGTQQDNGVVLTFDNRLDPDPTHPSSLTHPCGSGTVHGCVTEPDTDIIKVLVNGVEVDPCDVVNDQQGTLEVEFLAHDPDGHLAYYSLVATYAENLQRDLLHQPSSVLTAVPPTSAGLVGPTYGEALSPAQGAVAPHWYGGRFKLQVSLAEAFPEPCCYQLELRAYKRTIVSCDSDYDHHNLSEYTFGVGICPPPEE